jgi:hypothetical protein
MAAEDFLYPQIPLRVLQTLKNVCFSLISMVFDQLYYGLIVTLRIFFISGMEQFSIGLRELIVNILVFDGTKCLLLLPIIPHFGQNNQRLWSLLRSTPPKITIKSL